MTAEERCDFLGREAPQSSINPSCPALYIQATHITISPSLSFSLSLVIFLPFLLFVLMEPTTTATGEPAKPHGNHTNKNHNSSSSHSQPHYQHHGILSSTSILIIIISSIAVIVVLAIFLIIVMFRRIKFTKKRSGCKEICSINNTSSRFIAQTTINFNSSPGNYPISEFVWFSF